MEITVPTVNDPALAPAGQHVLSAVVQYVPYALKDGWARQRDRFIGSLHPSLLDALRAGAQGEHRGGGAADAARYRAGVSDQRRTLAPRRAGLRPVLHGAAGAGRRSAPYAACRASTSAGRAAIRAAASWAPPDATPRGKSWRRPDMSESQPPLPHFIKPLLETPFHERARALSPGRQLHPVGRLHHGRCVHHGRAGIFRDPQRRDAL